MIPVVEVDATLPIATEAETIAALIREHQVVIVSGETGSGKTTQLPKICLMAGRRHIAHTQPRRIAARNLAQRIAAECGVEIGEFVGYQVRFTRKITAATRVKVMTDGILLSELAHDRDLTRYDTIIIDEAHERSLNIDFLLGYLKQLLPRRRDLRVIVTSATIDTARFSAHFDDAPVVEVPGRTYPVEVRYQPLGDGQDEIDGVAAAVEEIITGAGTGDILVFLSGEREIRDASEAIEALGAGLEVVPLFARLSAADQQRVFQAHSGRRVVLATNVAETSITVPGVRYVIDTGMARISRYSTRTKVQRLPIEPVSQASANQRAGRCGRVGPGVAIRLYSEEDYTARPRFSDPEILRTNLATVILLMAQAGLGDIESFPFVEAPITAHLNDGVRVLNELGAVHPRKRHDHLRLTRTGRMLARLPVDPRLGRMLIEGSRRGCLATVLILVAGLAVPDVRERPASQSAEADRLHRRFWYAVGSGQSEGSGGRHTGDTGTWPQQETSQTVEGGDFEVLLNIWSYLTRRRRELSGSAFRRMCRAEHLSFIRFREWEDLVSQLRDAAKELGLDVTGRGTMPQVLTSLLSGLLSNVGLVIPEKDKPRRNARRLLTEYQGARGARFAIQPGSVLAKRTPSLVMAFELVETSRLWARTLAKVETEWIEQVAGHVLVRNLSEPRFAARTATVIANERLTLFGVPVVAGRRTGYAASHPVQAREIFLRSGIVEGQWATRNELIVTNREVMAEATRLTDRMRRPDLLLSDDGLYAFYDERVPVGVVSGASFDKWLRESPREDWPWLNPAQAVIDADQFRPSDFPDRWEAGGHQLPVRYTYEPGAGGDGLSVTVRLEMLGQLDPDDFSWQVPGLRAELATGLIRSLPKSVRTNFVPAPGFAAKALAWLEEREETGRGRFTSALERALTALTGVVIDPGQWRPQRLAPHLRTMFVVVDRGHEIARGEDLGELKRELSPKVTARLTSSSHALAISGQRSWSFGELPRETRAAGGLTGYPALTDEGGSVGVQVFDTRARADRAHRQGVRRLLTLTNPDPTKWVVAHLGREEKLSLADSAYPTVPELLADAWLKAGEQLAVRLGPLDEVRTKEDYERLALAVRQACPEQMRKVIGEAAAALAAATQARMQCAVLDSHSPLRRDVESQLENLLFNRFISATPDPWFAQLPRYARAVVFRLQAARSQPGRDAKAQEQVDEVEDLYAELVASQPPGPLLPQVEEIAFLIEEFRVSLFAQQLRTHVPVSSKRIRQAIHAVSWHDGPRA